MYVTWAAMEQYDIIIAIYAKSQGYNSIILRVEESGGGKATEIIDLSPVSMSIEDYYHLISDE